MRKTIWSALTFFLFPTLTAMAEPWPEMTREREREMALSAAPEHLRAEAAVYVLGEKGFEKVRDSANGFACLVTRFGQVLGPVCYDAEGARTTLVANLRQAALKAAGTEPEKVTEIMAAEYESGQLEAPARPGIAYMLSHDFVSVDPETREAKKVYPPHLMFYAPYMKNEDIGALPDHTGSQVTPWVLSPGKPDAYIIVVPPEHRTEP